MLLEKLPLPQLDRLEWKAVSIALRDAEDYAHCPSPHAVGRWERLLDRILGRKRPAPLADPKLEILRSFVCETRRRRVVAEDMVPAMIGQGYSRSQIDAIALLSA